MPETATVTAGTCRRCDWTEEHDTAWDANRAMVWHAHTEHYEEFTALIGEERLPYTPRPRTGAYASTPKETA